VAYGRARRLSSQRCRFSAAAASGSSSTAAIASGRMPIAARGFEELEFQLVQAKPGRLHQHEGGAHVESLGASRCRCLGHRPDRVQIRDQPFSPSP